MRRSVTGTVTRTLIDYTPTEPLLVVEGDADACFEHDRSRHPAQFCRVRLDLYADEISGVEARGETGGFEWLLDRGAVRARR